MQKSVSEPDSFLEFPSLQLSTPRSLFSVQDVAGKLKVTCKQIVNLIDEGRLEGINVGCGKRKQWRIPLESFMNFIKTNNSRDSIWCDLKISQDRRRGLLNSVVRECENWREED